MSMTEPAAKWSAILFGLSAAATIGGSLAHSKAGVVLGCCGAGVSLLWWLLGPYGLHEFSRSDGRWMSGPCLNYRSGAIMGFGGLNAEIANVPQEAKPE